MFWRTASHCISNNRRGVRYTPRSPVAALLLQDMASIIHSPRAEGLNTSTMEGGSRSFTVRTETGEVRLMTQEEVNNFVRRTIQRAKSTSGQQSVETSISGRRRENIRLRKLLDAVDERDVQHNFARVIGKTGGRTRERRLRVSPQAVRDVPNEFVSDSTVSGEMAADGRNNSRRQKMSNEEINLLIRNSIHRARLAREAVHARTITTSASIPSRFDPYSPVGTVNRKLSWSSMEDGSTSGDDSDANTNSPRAYQDRPRPESTKSKESNHWKPFKDESDKAIEVDTVELKESQDSTAAPTESVQRPDEGQNTSPKVPESVDAKIKGENAAHRILSHEEISEIVLSCMERAQNVARAEIKVLHNDAGPPSPTGKRQLMQKEVATIALEAMHRARMSAQEEIRALVRDSFRNAPESAQAGIRKTVRNSMQQARETAKEEMSILVRNIVKKENENESLKRTFAGSGSDREVEETITIGNAKDLRYGSRGALLSRSTSSDTRGTHVSGSIKSPTNPPKIHKSDKSDESRAASKGDLDEREENVPFDEIRDETSAQQTFPPTLVPLSIQLEGPIAKKKKPIVASRGRDISSSSPTRCERQATLADEKIESTTTPSEQSAVAPPLHAGCPGSLEVKKQVLSRDYEESAVQSQETPKSPNLPGYSTESGIGKAASFNDVNENLSFASQREGIKQLDFATSGEREVAVVSPAPASIADDGPSSKHQVLVLSQIQRNDQALENTTAKHASIDTKSLQDSSQEKKPPPRKALPQLSRVELMPENSFPQELHVLSINANMNSDGSRESLSPGRSHKDSRETDLPDQADDEETVSDSKSTQLLASTNKTCLADNEGATTAGQEKLSPMHNAGADKALTVTTVANGTTVPTVEEGVSPKSTTSAKLASAKETEIFNPAHVQGPVPGFAPTTRKEDAVVSGSESLLDHVSIMPSSPGSSKRNRKPTTEASLLSADIEKQDTKPIPSIEIIPPTAPDGPVVGIIDTSRKKESKSSPQRERKEKGDLKSPANTGYTPRKPKTPRRRPPRSRVTKNDGQNLRRSPKYSSRAAKSRWVRRAKELNRKLGPGPELHPRDSSSDDTLSQESSFSSAKESRIAQQKDDEIGNVVITDEFLHRIASRKGSKMTPQELQLLLQTQTTASKEVETAPSKPSNDQRDEDVSAHSYETKRQPRFCMGLMDFWEDVDELIDNADDEYTLRSNVISSIWIDSDGYETELVTDFEETRRPPQTSFSFSIKEETFSDSYEETDVEMETTQQAEARRGSGWW